MSCCTTCDYFLQGAHHGLQELNKKVLRGSVSLSDSIVPLAREVILGEFVLCTSRMNNLEYLYNSASNVTELGQLICHPNNFNKQTFIDTVNKGSLSQKYVIPEPLCDVLIGLGIKCGEAQCNFQRC